MAAHKTLYLTRFSVKSFIFYLTDSARVGEILIFPSTGQFILQIAATADTGTKWSQKPELHMGIAAQGLGSSFTTFPSTLAWSWTGVVYIWDASVTSRGLTYCTITLQTESSQARIKQKYRPFPEQQQNLIVQNTLSTEAIFHKRLRNKNIPKQAKTGITQNYPY